MTKDPVQLPIRQEVLRKAAFRMARAIAWVAACFCVVVAGGIVVQVVRGWAQSPLAAADALRANPRDPLVAQWVTLQRELAVNPLDDALKERIRRIDLTLRQRHSDRQVHIVRGGYLLLGGLIVVVLSLKAAAQWGPAPPGVMTVFSPPQDAWRTAGPARAAVLTAGALTVAGLAVLGSMSAPVFEGPAPEAQVPVPRAASREAMLANWPFFRGAQAGFASTTSAPRSWDGESGKGILWKTAVPLPGHNSPIVWEGRVYLTGATKDRQAVFCFDASSGAILWERAVSGPVPGSELNVFEETGYAAPTMATDGRRVYALFPTGDVAAFDLDGAPLWSRNLGLPDSMYGMASSLVTYEDRLIVQYDQGTEQEDGKSALLALDGATGAPVWRVRRFIASSWASPLVIYPESGPQIITAGRPWVIGYEASTGRELWKANLLEVDVGPSPAFAAGMVFVANEQAHSAAIRIDGRGDVTSTHVIWTSDEHLPDLVSPLALPEHLLLVESLGMVLCVESRTGRKLWEYDTEASCVSSPVYAGGMVYLVDVKGITHMFELGATFQGARKASLGEPVWATPAIVGNRIFIRGKNHLYCIGGE